MTPLLIRRFQSDVKLALNKQLLFRSYTTVTSTVINFSTIYYIKYIEYKKNHSNPFFKSQFFPSLFKQNFVIIVTITTGK